MYTVNDIVNCRPAHIIAGDSFASAGQLLEGFPHPHDIGLARLRGTVSPVVP